MIFKVTYLGEGQECSTLVVDAEQLVSVPGERPPTLEEVIAKTKTEGGFWDGHDCFIPYHNIRSISSDK